MKSRRSLRKRNRTIRKNKKIQHGGNLKCSLPLEPKCGAEGCVYFTEDHATKILVVKESRIRFLQQRFAEQEIAASRGLAPKTISFTIRDCSKINIEGKDSPCYVKRGFPFRSGHSKISFSLQESPSWCRGYEARGKKYNGYSLSDATNCELPELSFKHMLGMYSKSHLMVEDAEIPVPNIDEIESNNSNNTRSTFSSITDSIDEKFINQHNLKIVHIVSERVKGITINDLYQYLFNIGKDSMIPNIGALWDSEMAYLNMSLKQININISDININNVMIDTNDEKLCDFITSKIAAGIDITPDLIKTEYDISNILKMVDWGL